MQKWLRKKRCQSYEKNNESLTGADADGINFLVSIRS